MADRVASSEDVKTDCMMEKVISSHQVNSHPINKEPLSSLLPLPRLHSSSLSPVCPPSDQVYLQAAAIFQQLRTEKPVTHQRLHYGKKTDTPLPKSGEKRTQKQAYHLAFSTLKYQDLLEDIITDSCFQSSQHIDRRFLLHKRSTKEGEEAIQEVRDMENSLQRCKTKLAASLARCRVKLNLQSVSCFLSDPVRTKQHRAKCLPLYGWINTLKTSLEEVCEALQIAGLCEVKNMTDLKELTFCKDPLCPDTLVFSRQVHALLQNSSLTATHVLNMQDRSVCVAVSALRPLLFDKGDVMVVGSFSAMTVAHIAVAAAARFGRVLVCGADQKPSHVEEIQDLLTKMNIKNSRVLSEAFCSLNEWDSSIQRLKVIIVLPQCSSSALNDPVPTIHSEHGDWDVLPHLSHGSVTKSKIHSLTSQQARLLAHALTFPKVQTVVYCTRSVYPEENEQLVNRVIEKTHTHPKLLPFRLNGPIFPDDSPSSDMTDSKLFRLKPSQLTNGCFITRLSRQADPTKVETIQDVLARAAAKGLLGGIIPEQSNKGKKGKNKKNPVASADGEPSSPSSQERQTGGELVDAVSPSDHEEEKDEGDFKESEEDREKVDEKEENKEGKGEKKRRGLKERKRVIKRKQTKTTTAVTKHQPQSNKKKPTKTEVNQSHPKKRLTRNKPRRIPRLTLTLMSSVKPSNHLSPLSPITALARKLSVSPAIKSEQTVLSSPSSAGKHLSYARAAPSAPHAPSRKHNTQPDRAEKTPKDTTTPTRKVARPENVVLTQEVLKAADCVLPPISCPSSSSPHSKSGSSLSQPLSRTSNSQLANTSASSSYNPGSLSAWIIKEHSDEAR